MNVPPPAPPSGGVGHQNVYPSLSIGFEDVNQSQGGPRNSQPTEDTDTELDAMDSEKASLVGPRAATSSDVAINITTDEAPAADEVPDSDTLLFRDGRRRIDFILAYTDLDDEKDIEKRERFQNGLLVDGLELEIEDKKFSQDLNTYFAKVHMPWRICLNVAELLKMKMPIQANDIDDPVSVQCCTPCGPCKPSVEEEEDFFTAPFYKDGNFVNYEGPDVDKPDFFSDAQRGRMVSEVLRRVRYGDDREQFGIKRLLGQDIFTAAYPLHDGPHKCDTAGVIEVTNKRQELYYEWAKPSAFMKEQPYDAIRHYFGEKVGIYFSWLGFYTLMLVPASIVGLIVFFYGLVTNGVDDLNFASPEICNKSNGIVICPLCDETCGYRNLSESCLYAKVTYVIDNPATIFFTIFMALWATFFIEFWKRHQARLQYDWDVADYEELEQNIRPEYEAAVTDKKKNPITQDYEPHMGTLERCLRVCSSLVFIFFLILLVLAAILGVIIYRIFIVVQIYQHGNTILKQQSRLITSVTAACLSVVAITILNKIYEKVAIILTNMETWKYQSEWEDAFTFKMYGFQFVNYYGTVIYIAFFKGQIIGSPAKYIRSFGFRAEECDPAGCLIELCIQLGIIMVGKQIFNNFKEIIIPILLNLWRAYRGKKKEETEEDKYTRWERDYDLGDFPEHGLYEEYLEMVIQYGFVTLFVACFPLAPFFALLNNIIEVRLDATKLVTQWKRPMAERAQDIGTWFFILVAVSKLSILFNACIIAFTSDFIQKSYYNYVVYNPDNRTDSGYIDWSLSVFRTLDFQNKSRPDEQIEIEAFGDANYSDHYCRYRDFRGPPGADNAYKLTATYWHILVAKLAFVLIFEHVTLAVAALINFLIPDTPSDVQERTLREKHLVKLALHERIKTDSLRHRNEAGSSDNVRNATSF